MKEVICTCCPQGCHLQVDEANDYKVTGNGCPNGIAYGKEELTHPTRIITRSDRCLHSNVCVCVCVCVCVFVYACVCALFQLFNGSDRCLSHS